MFYDLIGVVVINSFLLSYYAPVANEDKFLIYLAFREALCKGLFTHVAAAAAGIADAIATPVAGPVNVVPVAGVMPTRVEYQRITIKRTPCVICKQAAVEGRRGVK